MFFLLLLSLLPLPPTHPLSRQISKPGVGSIYMSLPSQVSVVDVATMGEVLDTFPVCASPISCISAVPQFNCNDPDVLAGGWTTHTHALSLSFCMRDIFLLWLSSLFQPIPNVTLIFACPSSGLSNARRKTFTSENQDQQPQDQQPTEVNGNRPSSYEATMWMGSDTGV